MKPKIAAADKNQKKIIQKPDNTPVASSDNYMSDSDAMPQKNPQNSIIQTKDIPIPSEAEDSDLIEKEWVERAKEIVEHTRHDPREQQKALSLMKADYMKKRYNRDIKVSEEDLN